MPDSLIFEIWRHADSDPPGSDPVVFLIAGHDEPVSAAGDRTFHRENDVRVPSLYVSDDRIIDDGTRASRRTGISLRR